MRNITRKAYKQLELQAEEAGIQSRAAKSDEERGKMLKVAAVLKDQLSNLETREDGGPYIYTETDLAVDVEDVLWKAAFRVSDYFGTTLDGVDTNDLIERHAEKFINEMRVRLGNTHGVGAYEPAVPGEEIEVSE